MIKIREKIYLLLKDIVIDKKYSHLVLKNGLDGYSLKDRKLASKVVYGTIQNYVLLKHQYADLLKNKTNEKLIILLNMSCYQLMMMDKIPAFAVLNEAVDIAKKYLGKGSAKLVNAILHKMIDKPIDTKADNPLAELALKTSLPLWLVKMWSKQYPDVYEKICLDTLNTPTTYVRLNTLKASLSDLTGNYELVDSTCLINCNEDVIKEDDFKKGYIIIQDYASQQVAKLLSPKESDIVLDMCAAPGSKTTQISALMNNRGSIDALELHEHRAKLILEQAERLGCENINVKHQDANTLDEKYHNYYDCILLDAPCSGYGVLKHKSDIKLHMQPTDMDEIIVMQKNLLESANRYLKDGGTLVYSTCTLNKKENDKQIAAFIKRHPEYEIIEEKTLFPFEHNCDGFYMAKLIKQT